jgi:hypothetical protein
VPAEKVGFFDEPQPRIVVGDLPDEEAVWIPAVKDIADVEDDGSRSQSHAKNVIASAAKQSSPTDKARWIAASLRSSQ